MAGICLAVPAQAVRPTVGKQVVKGLYQGLEVLVAPRAQAGHALAAAAEGVGMHHAACFLVLLLPGAYVMLDTDTLAVLGPLRALRVRTRIADPRSTSCSCQWLPQLVSA